MLAEGTFAARVADRLELAAAVQVRARAVIPAGGTVLALGAGEIDFWSELAADALAFAQVIPAGADEAQLDGKPAATPPPSRHAVRADLTALPFHAEAFDAVVSVQSLAATSNPAAVVREAAKVVVRGGALVLGEIDWVSLAWEHPNRQLSELIRQAALRRVAPLPYRTRELVAQVRAAGWESIRVEARTLVETTRGAVLLSLAEQATNWAINSARCPSPAANAWLADLRAAADHGAFLATITAHLLTAERET